MIIYIVILKTPSSNTIEDGNYNHVNNTNTTQTYIIIGDNPNIDIPLLSILFLFQTYIYWYVNKYYNLIPTEEEKRRITFNEIQNI